MRGNRPRDTKPELAVRSRLHRLGYRFRVDYRAVLESRGRVDIAFPSRRVAVMIDGCFWHGCPEHGTIPKRNAEYWLPKLSRNIERDREQTLSLEANGWCVLRFWEHEQPDAIVEAIVGERGLRGIRRL